MRRLEWSARTMRNTPEQITAEVVALPRDFRFANVVVRPAVRRYEINHGVSAGVDPQYVIPLNELVVGVRQERFYVRWVRRVCGCIVCAGHCSSRTNGRANANSFAKLALTASPS